MTKPKGMLVEGRAASLAAMRLGELRHFWRFVQAELGEVTAPEADALRSEFSRTSPRLKVLRAHLGAVLSEEGFALDGSMGRALLRGWGLKLAPWDNIAKSIGDLAGRGIAARAIGDIIKYSAEREWPREFDAEDASDVLDRRWPSGKAAQVDAALELLMFLQPQEVQRLLDGFMRS